MMSHIVVYLNRQDARIVDNQFTGTASPSPIEKDLGPGLQSFLKVKVTLTLREVILRHDNEYLIIIFRPGFVFSRLGTSTMLFINILNKV